MKTLKGIFTCLRVVGLVGIVILLLYVEWSCVRQNFSLLLNAYVHIFVLYTLFILPPFWFLLGITTAGYVGKFVIRRRIQQAAAA